MKLTDNTINSLGNFIDKLENSIKTGLMDIEALNNGAKKMEEIIREKTPIKTGKGRSYIRHFKKIDGKTLKVIKVGFDGAGWEHWKGLYFNHYGFNNKRTGTYVDKHKGWFDRAYKSGRKEVEEIIKSNIARGIDERL